MVGTRPLAGAAAAAALLFFAQNARAASPLNVPAGATVTVDGDKTYSDVVVEAGGTLKVSAKSADGSGLGYLHIKANRIVIAAGATVSAAGAGFRGQDGSAGDGPMTSSGGGFGTSPNDAGGGGAYRGNGGPGLLTAICTLTADGGASYPDAPAFGSAGGAANVASTPGTRGGNGGGQIILEAAEIQILGTVDASGEAGPVTSQVGSGGGAGGYVEIVANVLVVDGSSSVIRARGGNGGAGATSSGGGGGGGLVLLRAPTIDSALIDVSGGLGTAACGTIGDGAPGQMDVQAAPSCLDLDGDGVPSSLCGAGSGGDCDDSDPLVFPSAIERCDGIDQDCSGTADDALPADACGTGLMCSEGSCVDASEGAGGGGGAPQGAAPAGIDLSGGCQFGSADSNVSWGVLITAVAAAMRCRGRRRRVR